MTQPPASAIVSRAASNDNPAARWRVSHASVFHVFPFLFYQRHQRDRYKKRTVLALRGAASYRECFAEYPSLLKSARCSARLAPDRIFYSLSVFIFIICPENAAKTTKKGKSVQLKTLES